MKTTIHVESKIPDSARVRQLEGMFDVPRAEVSKLHWTVDMPIETRDWNVGLVVGPSGAGKSTIAERLWGKPRTLKWTRRPVVDDFAKTFSMEDIAAVCQAVGFNTIPAWMRPHAVLSAGERFRVELARRLLEGGDPIVVDEFTSVVDRQVARIGSHAVQKHVRRNGQKFVAVSCHHDIIDWLQPDWTYEPAEDRFTWREVRRRRDGSGERPSIDVELVAAPLSSWRVFAPFHYLTSELHRNARCFVLHVGGTPAAFVGALYRPHPKARNIMGISRLVTLPDWQGLGLAFVAVERVAAAYARLGYHTHTYPAHPALIRGFDRSPRWQLRSKPGNIDTISETSVAANEKAREEGRNFIGEGWSRTMGTRPNAVFRYAGGAAGHAEAEQLLAPLNVKPPSKAPKPRSTLARRW